jgi:hypothetical protein
MNPGDRSDSREGDDYVYSWSNSDIVMVFTEPRESHGDLYSEITVYLSQDDGDRVHLLGPTRHNLLGPRARPEFAKLLALRAASSWGADKEVDLDKMTEQAFAHTVLVFREGAPVARLSGPLPDSTRRTFLLDPLIPANETTMIYADGDSGKSYLALFCSLALGLGQPLAGGRLFAASEQRYDTLYLDWETKRDMVWRRWDRICRGAGLEHSLDTLSYQQPLRSLPSIGAEVRKRIHEADQYAKHEGRVGLGLVVVDAISMAVGTDLLTADAATALFNTCNSFGCAVLLLHHMSKESIKQKGGGAEAYGTIFFRNATRNSWELRTDDYGVDDRILGLEHRKANEGPRRREPLVLHLHFDGTEGPVTLSGGRAPQGGNIDSRRNLGDRILDTLKGGAREIESIAEDLDMNTEKGQTNIRVTLGLATPGGGTPADPTDSDDPMSKDVPW